MGTIRFSLMAVAMMTTAVFTSCNSTKDSSVSSSKSIAVDKSLIGKGGGEGATDFYVASVSPNEEVPSSVSFPSIQIQFSEPVVPLSKLGEPAAQSDVVTIVPKLNGVFRWYGTSLLSFDTSDALIPQKEYAVTVNPSLKSVNGTEISGPVCFTFHTEELQLRSVEPGYTARKEKKIHLNPNDIPPEYATDLAVTFSNKVNPSVVTKFLAVNDSDGKSYSYKASAIDEKSILLKFGEQFPRDKEIKITLKNGAVPDTDCWPTSKEQNRTFHTLRPMQFLSVNGTSSLAVSFNHQIKSGTEKQIFDALTFSPEMDVDISHLELHGNTIFIRDLPVTFNDTYTVSLKGGAVSDVYEQTYAEKISEQIIVPDADSFVNFRDGNFAILESQFEPKRAFEFQNVEKESTYTITPICGATDSFKLPGAKTFTFKTTDETKNRRVIQTIDLKDFLEKTDGEYRGAVKLESTAYFKGYGNSKYGREVKSSSFILVTDLALSVHSAWNETVVLVTKMSTGEPVANADIAVRSVSEQNDAQYSMLKKTGTTLATAKTDENGMAVLRFDSPINSRIIRYIDATTKDDRIVMSLRGWWGDTPFTAATIENGEIYSAGSKRSIKPEDIKKGQNVTHIFSDRGLYRPGETASFKIIDRTLILGKYSTYTGPYEIKIKDSNYWRNDAKVYGTFNGSMTAQGTASAEWKLPEDLRPGTYMLTYRRTDGSGFQSQQSVNVQFFERLRFQASGEITPMVYYRGDSVSAKVSASYLGGGSLAGGSVHADWSRYPTSFTPSGEKFAGYEFGPSSYSPVKYRYAVFDEDVIEEEYDDFHESSSQNLSAEGTAHLSVASGSEPKKGTPYTYHLEAQVTDAGNQMIAVRAGTIVHPASFYIGLSGVQNIKGFPKKGEKLTFNYLLATPEGNSPEAVLIGKDKKISWSLTRETWEEQIEVDEYGWEYSEWVPKTVVEAEGKIDAKDGNLTVTPKEGGSYQLHLETTDAQGRTVLTERTFYVTGSDLYRRNGDEIQINLMNDKNEYEVGETAHIALESPIEKGRYLVTLEREGIISEKIIEVEKTGAAIDIPIEDWHVPVIYVSVSSYTTRNAEPPADYDTRDEHKPRHIFARTVLNVSTKSRRFDIDVQLDKKSYLPGDDAKVNLTATKNGKPVSNAEITLMAVDRGVLDLIGYHAGDPMNTFWNSSLFNDRASNSNSFDSIVDPVTYGTYTLSAKEREMLYYTRNSSAVMMKSAEAAPTGALGVMDDMMVMEEACEAEAADEDSGSGEEGSVQVRKDFRATAVFLPTLTTGADGKVSAEFKLPDSLTEYVVTVIGVKENDYAYGESPLTVANPISVRDVETRILRPGDNGEAGVVITNIGDKDENVTVEFEVLSGLEKTGYKAGAGDIARIPGKASVSGAAKKSIIVKSGDTTTLMFRIDAQSQGWITLSFKVKSSSVNEVIYKGLEIEKPYIYESVTTVGQIDADENGANEKIIFPAGNDDGRGAFYIQLDATRLGALRSAVDYVFRYPYGCLEQRSSAVMPLVAFGDYISVFGLQSEVADPRAVVEKEISSWADVQKPDGGFPYWPDGEESSFAVSLRIAEIIALSKEHGIKMPSKLSEKKLVSYIRSELKKLDEKGWWYPKAYSYYVLTRIGEKVSSADIKTILEKDTGVSEYAFAGLAAYEMGDKANVSLAVKKIKNLMALTTRGASFQDSAPFAGWYFYNSNPERYALALHLFTKADADDIYNGHLVWQLLELEKGSGRWHSTASTSRVLIALDTYIRDNKLQDTNLTAEVLLNGKKILSGKFEGAGAMPVEENFRFGEMDANTKARDEKFNAEWTKLDVPLEKEVPLEITKSGTGKLFYTAGMTYALPAAEQKARDEGLCVYVEITDARTGEKVDGSKLKSGTIYREKVYVTSTKERTFVAVRAPVPAGCEILNPAFQTTATVPSAKEEKVSSNRWWIPRWRMSHQDIYDAEIRCFWDYIPIGSQSFEFTFRAQRDGTYETPATLAECMYEPEIFGRSNGKVWTVEK